MGFQTGCDEGTIDWITRTKDRTVVALSNESALLYDKTLMRAGS